MKIFDENFTLQTERLILRPYRLEDWERVHIYGQSADFCKYEPWGPNSEQDSKNFVSAMVREQNDKPRYRFNLTVIDRISDLLIGGCGIRRDTEASSVGSLGWAINPKFQNRGLATEAARALIEFGRRDLNFAVIYALCDTRNAASARVMEKLGMRRVGIVRGTKEVKGHMRDVYRYELRCVNA
jgi:RimJ/RimL family protein N-acetyltransferase